MARSRHSIVGTGKVLAQLRVGREPSWTDGFRGATARHPWFDTQVAGSRFLFAITIFSSAFLLFLVQPIIAKQILPWFGGSAAVWTTCLVFFQTTLLLGYAYADWVVRTLTPRRQFTLHATLLVASLFCLPIMPGAFWKPTGSESPIVLILGLLAATIGLPYFLLSTTSPLAQAWFTRRLPGRNPYRLFALSNLASVAALLGYPFLLEPWIATRVQAWGWSIVYAAFAVLCVATAWWSLRAATASPVADPASSASVEAAADAPGAARQLLWCSLAAMASLLLLAVSNHVTQNIASVPLLWIVPLSIYLFTFILCFDAPRWYQRTVFLAIVPVALGVMAWILADPARVYDLKLQIGTFCVGLFVACMFCHGELARLKPAPRYLTRYYLMIALGGATGSVLVGIVAPLVLPAYFELALGLVLAALFLAWQVRASNLAIKVLAVACVSVTMGSAAWGIREFYDSTVLSARNFYGVLRVQEAGDGEKNRRLQLVHGTIMHGNQYLAPEWRRRPSAYYTPVSGIGRALTALRASEGPLRVGVLGLGAGTLAAWGGSGDVYRFYDINPTVFDIALNKFTYLADSEAKIETVLGDARLNLEREPPQGFDLLAVDAFSGDAIPVHLVTAEALAIYRRHMKPHGVIAFNVTNRFLDIAPVVKALADAQGLRAILIHDNGAGRTATRSDWVLVASDGAILDQKRVAEKATDIVADPGRRLWTDDFNSLLQVLK